MTQGDCCPIDGHKEFMVEFVDGKTMYRCLWCNTRWYPEQLVSVTVTHMEAVSH